MSARYLNKTKLEAELFKCLNCVAKPCHRACPLKCSPNEFIAKAKQKDFAGAVASICATNPLPHICGLICPERFCMKACLRGRIDHPINIPAVQATLIEGWRKDCLPCPTKLNGLKIAVIGAGPAGMAAAWKARLLGLQVTIFEKENKIGGTLNLIPTARLPQKAVLDDWAHIQALGGIDICFNACQTNTKELLEDGFDGVIVTTGEQTSVTLGIEGEDLTVPYADYLKNPTQYATKGKVGIIGGGNVAADCALTAKELGASEVSLFIRRKIFDMKVSLSEITALIEKGIDLVTTTRLCKVKKENGHLTALTCTTQKGPQGYEDVENSTIQRQNFDLIIKAIGAQSAPTVDESNIIYAGDCKTGSSTAAEAVASGIEAAEKLYHNLTGGL